jgi:hypothetical protein
MTQINCKLLTTSTTIVKGKPGRYTLQVKTQTIDSRITKPQNSEIIYSSLDDLAADLGRAMAKTITRHYQDGHTFNITIKDFETPSAL